MDIHVLDVTLTCQSAFRIETDLIGFARVRDQSQKKSLDVYQTYGEHN